MLNRLLATGVVALFAVSVPGSGGPAYAEPQPPLPSYHVVAGTKLAPRFVLPVRGYRLTGRFGARSYLWSSLHTGLDFAAPVGTPIRSLTIGRVTAAGYDGRYGNKTVITLADGTELWFCHQSSILVRVGQWVTPGQLIGYVGATGNVTGSHLHLEVRPAPERPVDPMAWLRARGLRP
jgi:murein DD-endopeptidase MepM/ murein hydrolase activator NlpD